jgi:gliding motility-associated-like protein
LICAGDIVSLNGNVSNSGSVTWTTTGDGTFSPSDTINNPAYIPGPNDTANGSVTVIFSSSGNSFCSGASDSLVITINSKPNALFTSGPACLNAAVAFTDQSTNSNGAINSWYWSAGADTSTQQNASFTFTTTGTQTVTLVVSTAAGCADTITQTLTVNPLPQVDFTSSITCPTDVVLTGNGSIASGSIVSWNWDLGDSTSSTLQNPAYTYADTGTYIVTLAVMSDSGCVSSFTDSLILVPCANTEVNPPAVPTAFTPNGDGHNDVLYVKGGPFTELDFRIYNEWGNLIFRSGSQSIGWDGTYKSKAQPEGSYVWTIKATTADGTEVKATGEVTIIR